MFRLVDKLCSCFDSAVWTTLVLSLFLAICLILFCGCRCLFSRPISSSPLPSSSASSAAIAAPTPVPTPSSIPTLNSVNYSEFSNSYRPPLFRELAVSAPKPKSLPQSQLAKETEETKNIVSRPIIPESVTPESVVVKKQVLSSKHVSDSVVAAEKFSEKSSDNEVEILKRRIAELEKAATENTAKNTEKIENAEQSTVVSQPVGLPPKLPRRIPTFNESGVTVSSDAERIRIEITDKTLFTSGTWKLNPEAENLLRKVAGEIRAGDPDASLEIEGHTDCLNSDPANSTQKHDIATVKAMTVMEYFVNVLQWNPEKIRPTSFGSGKPVDDNGIPEGRIRNNRIEIVVLPQK